MDGGCRSVWQFEMVGAVQNLNYCVHGSVQPALFSPFSIKWTKANLHFSLKGPNRFSAVEVPNFWNGSNSSELPMGPGRNSNSVCYDLVKGVDYACLLFLQMDQNNFYQKTFLQTGHVRKWNSMRSGTNGAHNSSSSYINTFQAGTYI